ncbi:hypothetical protein RJ640_019728 [Escallonia rubra]|uniref:DDE Tnp4 domain-containing protein n=1 Tax=Escallonia rubra TaxID=112253 RepID=A0AA88QPC9_9ASTE|nr:hypothetical protein RJ640_019728 [Escallonia rubra]
MIGSTKKRITACFCREIIDQLRFLDIVTGLPGSMTVSRLLKCSGFYRLCEGGERLNGNAKMLFEGTEFREYIVRGVGYPLLPWLITPFGRDGMSAAISDFNAMLEASRFLAVKAFLQLKGSWRILNKVMWRTDKRTLPSIIFVCCLLHNIIIDCGDMLQPDVPLSVSHDLGCVEQCCKQIDPLGRTMRENLAELLQHTTQKAASS